MVEVSVVGLQLKGFALLVITLAIIPATKLVITLVGIIKRK